MSQERSLKEEEDIISAQPRSPSPPGGHRHLLIFPSLNHVHGHNRFLCLVIIGLVIVLGRRQLIVSSVASSITGRGLFVLDNTSIAECLVADPSTPS